MTITLIKDTNKANTQWDRIKGKPLFNATTGRKFTGNVHIMPDGTVHTGKKHSDKSVKLSLRRIKR